MILIKWMIVLFGFGCLTHDLEFVKVDGNHPYVGLSFVLWLTEQLDRLDNSLLPLLRR